MLRHQTNFETAGPMSKRPEVFIGSQLKIKLNDCRILDGVLTVIDPFGNLLMSNVYETAVEESKREIGLVSVPRESIDKVFMKETNFRQLSK